MLNLKSERYNKGYKIIDSCTIGEYEYCLGFNPDAPQKYVTWMCTQGTKYFWGHYFNRPDRAYEDLYRRAADEAMHYAAYWNERYQTIPFEEE